jgi:hypothetical protein
MQLRLLHNASLAALCGLTELWGHPYTIDWRRYLQYAGLSGGASITRPPLMCLNGTPLRPQSAPSEPP